MIRIVGLSATLPNYADVALFLKVNPSSGLFHFGPAYRPVPLTQTFVGVPKPNVQERNKLFLEIAYDKALAAIRRGKQVMVFVHARNDTNRTARALVERAKIQGEEEEFKPNQDEHPMFTLRAKEVNKSRSPEVREFFSAGFGVHHAGMLRADRTLSEKLFADGLINVLVCTATLAWGVNLPAHTVIIKGTQLYNPEKGSFVDLGVLDVQQIFGRAGRPQFDTHGEGIIITQHAKLAHYLQMLTSSLPIESQFISRLSDHLSAEIALGTVTSVREAVQWLSYTYLYVRMMKNPLAYGIPYEQHLTDPRLVRWRVELVEVMARRLDTARMIRFHPPSGSLDPTELGRTASHFYLSVETVEMFNEQNAPTQNESDILHTLCCAAEFSQIKVREEEMDELENLHQAPLTVRGGLASKEGKTCVLMQAFIGGLPVRASALVSDCTFIAQSAARIARGLFEIALGRGWLSYAEKVLRVAKSLEQRAWQFNHPLRQINTLPYEVYGKLEGKRASVQTLREMSASEIGDLINHQRMGTLIKQEANRLPHTSSRCRRSPITRTVLRVTVTLAASFEWVDRIHGARAVLDLGRGKCSARACCTLHTRERAHEGERAHAQHERHARHSPRTELPPALSQMRIEPVARGQPGPPRFANAPEPSSRLGTVGAPIAAREAQAQPALRGGIAHVCDSVLSLSLSPPSLPPPRGPPACPQPHYACPQPLTLAHHLNRSRARQDTENSTSTKELWVLPKAKKDEEHVLSFTIPSSSRPPCYFVRCISNRWLGVETIVPLPLAELTLPSAAPAHTELLDLRPLPKSAVGRPEWEAIFQFSHFNPVQTQVFHSVYHTDQNILVGSPTGSGKTVTAELSVFRLLSAHPGMKAVYIAPLKAPVRERMVDWGHKFAKTLGYKLMELTGDSAPDARALATADIMHHSGEAGRRLATLAAACIRAAGGTRHHRRDTSPRRRPRPHPRSPCRACGTSRRRRCSRCVVGLSTAMANAHDLAEWLGIPQDGLFNFKPSVRPVPLEVHIAGFPGKHYCPRMATMNKPTYRAILNHSPDKPTLVFVSSRRQTRLTALDLIAYCSADEREQQFVNIAQSELEPLLARVKDQALRHTLAFGVGIHHAGLAETDRSIVEQLFVQQKIMVLVCTSTLAWGVNFPAHLVVVKGTEFYDGAQKRYVDFPVTDVLQMMGRAGRPQYDQQGVAVILVHEPKKTFYRKFLYEPFPVESQLQEQLHDHFNAEVVAKTIRSRQDGVDFLSWTYFYRRLTRNPAYYHLEDGSDEGIAEFLSNLVEATLADLQNTGCVEIIESESGVDVVNSILGHIASYYYLVHDGRPLLRRGARRRRPAH